MKLLPSCLFGLSFATCSAFALAGTPINETRDVDADARIDISNVQGSVKVTGWDRNQVGIEGTLGSGSRGLEVSGNASHLEIKVEGAERSGWFNWGSGSNVEDSILDIRVPAGVELSIETVSAEITVNAVSGRLIDIDTVSGKVRVDSNAREVEIGSVSGNVSSPAIRTSSWRPLPAPSARTLDPIASSPPARYPVTFRCAASRAAAALSMRKP